jgi:hypothetical protein
MTEIPAANVTATKVGNFRVRSSLSVVREEGGALRWVSCVAIAGARGPVAVEEWQHGVRIFVKQLGRRLLDGVGAGETKTMVQGATVVWMRALSDQEAGGC